MRTNFLRLFFKRLVSSLLLLFLMVSIIFILVRLSPGDPTTKFLSPNLSPQSIEKIKDTFNLNETILSQYFSFVKNLLTGNFGISYSFHQPVLTVIKNYLPLTIMLALFSFFIQTFLGFSAAFFSIKKMDGFADKFIDKLSIFLFAVPSFVLGVFLIFIFSEKLLLLPSSGLHQYGIESKSFFVRFIDYAEHLILPLITLSLSGAAIFYRYLRSTLEDIYSSNFVLHLRSMGIEENIITIKHILPNALGPFISAAGIELGLLLSGALITEVIFGLPGMGRLTIEAIMGRDYPLIVGTVFVSGILVILSNFLADLVKIKVDKRMLAGL